LLSFPPGGLAVVIGTSGGIGGAILGDLQKAGFAQVVGLSRRQLDITIEAEIGVAAAEISASGLELRLLVCATGLLQDASQQPEKSWRELDADKLARSFAVNAIGPALVMKHFLPLLPRQGKSVFAALSARVGSIGDNHLGGWYGYRAAKAALNQLIHSAAIELARRQPDALCVALHPGTVATRLSQPFAKQGLAVRQPAIAAADLLAVIDGLTAAQSGGFFDHHGASIPW
jgi:NAD(P)-dependent dehydrogenase (short-subunit alcohol dehydrogenase family)